MSSKVGFRLVLPCALSLFIAADAMSQPAKCASPPPTTPPVTISSQLPQDVCLSTGPGILYFDDFSWRSFVALVWPAAAGTRGQPDPSGVPGGNGTPVFQTYKGDWEIFQPNGAPPPAWNTYGGTNPCPNAPPGAFVLAAFSKFGNVGQATVGGLVGPLVSQNVQYTRFLAGFNQVEFDEIVNSKWYLQSNLTQKITFTPDSQQNNPIDIKSAWMIMTPGLNASRFYTTPAYVLDTSTGACTQQTVGLVGLHIVTKTPTRPQWIWSTFEQIDNIPQAGAPTPYNYNDGSGTAMPSSNPLQFPPNATPCVPPPAISGPCPFNVTRIKNMDPSTVSTNGNYQQALAKQGSGVWQYYQLTMTQWPTPGNAPQNPGTPAFTIPGSNTNPMTAFSNLTMETFDQANIRTGGMACHNAAASSAGAASDFQWALALNAYPSPLGTSASQPQLRASLVSTQTAAVKKLISLLSAGAQDMAASPKTAKPAKKPATKSKKKAQ